MLWKGSSFQSRNVFFNSKRHPYTGNLNSETLGDSKNALLHWGDVLVIQESIQAYSAAAAWLAHLQVYSTPLLSSDTDVAIAPCIFCPGWLFSIQHNVGPEPIHGDWEIQMSV